ncbi:PE/PPE C-terminal domain-containing protein, partial [Mycobacterium tuberculosis]
AATQAAGAGAVADAQATLAQLPPGILSDILSALAANADPLTSGLLGIASTLNPQVGSAQPIVIPTPIGELDVIALYIASIATGSIALAITNTARPWHIGLYGNAGGLGPTQGHPLSSATDEPEPHWGPFGGAAPVSAGVGHAALVGALSVPHSWTTAAPEIQLAVQATPTFSSSAGADPTALNGMPAGLLSGMALASLAARGTTGGGGTRSGTSTDGQEDGRKPPVVVIREQPPPGNPPR